jgi:coenzyme F420-reducing hydrogenase delta subunit
VQMGLEPQRFRLVWASAAEGVRLAHEITTMVEEVRALGPLHWGKANGQAAPILVPSLELAEVQP